MDPKQLSEELRQGKNPHMTRRRWIIGLSMLGGWMGQAVTLYQTGIALGATLLLPIAKGYQARVRRGTNVELARQEWSENKAFCEYCRRCDGLLSRVHRTRSAGGSYRCWHLAGTPQPGHQSTEQHTVIDTTGKSTDDFLQRCWAYSKC
jgi:hypothetical protein